MITTIIVDDHPMVRDAPGVKEGHLGLSSMSARARELGGTFVVKSEPGKGTVVIVEIPV